MKLRWLEFAGALLLLIVLFYCAAYPLLGHRSYYRDPGTGAVYQGFSYPTNWLAKLFAPAAWAESKVMQRGTVTGTVDDVTWTSALAE